MLTVYFEDRVVGSITSSADGPSFVYEDSWRTLRGAFPISTLAPLSHRGMEPANLLPWAANLLPEAAQLTAVGLQLGVAPGDVIGLLSEIGRDTAGALSFGARGTTRTNEWRHIANQNDLERIILELPNKPFLAGEEGVSMSLAGVQSKLAVARDSAGELYIPVNGSPSTHIFKPDSDRLFGSVQNEAFCLSLARLCGIAVPEITTGTVGDRSYFLIERYDRRHVGELWRRIHQEDFCQALGKPPAAKYERNRSGVPGATVLDMLGVARQRMSAKDVLSLLDMVVFNILCCNTDAHAKNYSILITARSSTLAPIYDVMSAEPYPGITRNLAQTIAGKNRGDHILRRHWQRFARSVALTPTLVLSRIERLANLVRQKAESARAMVEEMPAGGHFVLEQVQASVVDRSNSILRGLSDYTGAEDEPAASRSAAAS